MKTVKKIFFLVIILSGLAARFYLVLRLPIWYDEYFSSLIINKYPFSEIMSGIHDLTHPPGYYLLLKIWSIISVNLLWLRLLTIMTFLGNCYLLYQIGQKIINKYFSRILLFTYVFSGYFVIFDWQVRMYTPTLTLILLSLYLIQLNLSPVRLILLTLLNVFGLYFDYAFIWYFFPLLLIIFFEAFKYRDAFLRMMSMLGSLAIYILIWTNNLFASLQGGMSGISWMRQFIKPKFWVPYFLGSHDQYLFTIVFLVIFFLGLISITSQFRKSVIFIRLFFISFISLLFTLGLSNENLIIFHIRSLQIVGLTIVFIYAYAWYRMRKLNRVIFIWSLIYLINFWYHILSMQSLAGQYLISFTP